MILLVGYLLIFIFHVMSFYKYMCLYLIPILKAVSHNNFVCLRNNYFI